MPGSCSHCTKNYKDCEYFFDEDCFYEPDDYEGRDLGSAIVDEIRRQNDELY